MSTTKTILWLLLGKWSYYAITLISFSILLRYVTTEEYGIFAMASTVVIFADLFSVEGVESLVLKSRRTDWAGTCKMAAAISKKFLALIVFSVLSLLVGLKFVDVELYCYMLAVAILVAFIQVTGSVFKASLLKCGRAREYSAVGVLANAVATSIAIAIANSGGGIWALVIQPLVLHALVAVGSAVILKIGAKSLESASGLISSHSAADDSEFDKHLNNAMWSTSINVLTNRLDVFLVGYFLGAGQSGVLAFGKRVMQIIQEALGSVFDKVLLMRSSGVSRSEDEEYKTLTRGLTAMTALVVPAFFGVGLAGEALLSAVFGRQWAAAEEVVAILAIGGVFRCLVTLERAFLVSKNRFADLLRVRWHDMATTLLLLVPASLVSLPIAAAAFSLRLILGYFYAVYVAAGSSAAFFRRLKTYTDKVGGFIFCNVTIYAGFTYALRSGSMFGLGENSLLAHVLGAGLYLLVGTFWAAFILNKVRRRII